MIVFGEQVGHADGDDWTLESLLFLWIYCNNNKKYTNFKHLMFFVVILTNGLFHHWINLCFHAGIAIALCGPCWKLNLSALYLNCIHHLKICCSLISAVNWNKRFVKKIVKTDFIGRKKNGIQKRALGWKYKNILNKIQFQCQTVKSYFCHSTSQFFF